MFHNNQLDRLILVGGASGTGKSTLVESIDQQGIAIYRKIHGFAFDIAREKTCDIRTIFDQFDYYIPEIIRRMIAFTKEYHFVVSDFHFAIQPKSDTVFILEGNVSDKMLITEDYRPAFTAIDLVEIVNSTIILIPILIVCSVEELIMRRTKMVNKGVRSLKKEIIQKESVAEFEIYKSITKQLGLKPHIFTNSYKEPIDFQKEITTFFMSQF